MKESKFEILNERPEGMSFKKYREEIKNQSKRIKIYLKGTIIWPGNKGTFIGFVKDLS